MTRTTPPRPVNVLRALPELADHVRMTTRLHPRSGTPTAQDSSIGGPSLWPADEPWPVCDAEHEAPYLESGWWSAGSEARAQRQPNALVAIAQLYAADVPTVTFAAGADLLQVLWCPIDHSDLPGQADYFGPMVHVVWRQASAVRAVLADPPQPHTANRDSYLPKPCVLYPEQVVEYQYADLLPRELCERLDAWEDRTGAEYQYDLSIAPGCKAGGWATWHLTDPWHEVCAECGASLDLLVSLASAEWDGVISWRPVEEDPDNRDGQCDTRLTHGRWGDTRIFVCSVDVTHPFRLNVQ